MPINRRNKKRYPKNWKTEIVPRIAKRSGGLCEGSAIYPDCKAVNGKPHPITGSKVVLTVAHLNHIPEDCNDANLKHWCQRCHLAYDAKHHAQTRYMSSRCKLTIEMFEIPKSNIYPKP